MAKDVVGGLESGTLQLRQELRGVFALPVMRLGHVAAQSGDVSCSRAAYTPCVIEIALQVEENQQCSFESAVERGITVLETGVVANATLKRTTTCG